jgi:ABC-type multidrug transport system fused ATPase/permease subunit
MHVPIFRRDIEKVHGGVGTNLGLLVQYVSTFASGIVAAFYLNWQMTLILLGTTPFLVAPSGVFNQVSVSGIIIVKTHKINIATTAFF